MSAHRMNYNMAQLIDLEDNRKFALTYNKKIQGREDLFRAGNVKRPIVNLERRFAMSLEEQSSRSVDFVINGGKINITRSSGNFCSQYRVFQKFVPIVNCILSKAFSASLGKCKLIQVRNLSH